MNCPGARIWLSHNLKRYLFLNLESANSGHLPLNTLSLADAWYPKLRAAPKLSNLENCPDQANYDVSSAGRLGEWEYQRDPAAKNLWRFSGKVYIHEYFHVQSCVRAVRPQPQGLHMREAIPKRRSAAIIVFERCQWLQIGMQGHKLASIRYISGNFSEKPYDCLCVDNACMKWIYTNAVINVFISSA